MSKMLQSMIRDQFPDLIARRDQISTKVEYLQKTLLPLINEGLSVCYPESLASQLGSIEDAKHVQDTFRRTLSLILANYQRMTLTDVELAKLVDLGHIHRQFRLIHSNCYVLRAYSAVGLANILEAKLQRDFSRKVSVAIIRARREKKMIKTTKLYLHDIELEVKNVPVNYGAEVRQTIKSLRLHSKSLIVSREVGFHQVGSVPFERLKQKFKDSVSMEYTSHNEESEADLMMFESFSQKKLDQAISEFRKLRWDKFFFFELENLTSQQLASLKEIYENRNEFIELGENWLERLMLMYDGEKEEGVSALLSAKLEEKHILKDEVIKKANSYTVCRLQISRFQYQLLQIKQGKQTALQQILKPGKCLANIEEIRQNKGLVEELRYVILLEGFRAVKTVKDEINETLDRILRETIKLNLQEYIERQPILSLKIEKLKEKIPQLEQKYQVVICHFFAEGIKKLELYGPLQRVQECEQGIMKYLEAQHPIEAVIKGNDQDHLTVIVDYLKELNRLYQFEFLFNVSPKELTVEIYSCNLNLSKAEVKQLLVMLDASSLPKLLEKELNVESEVLNEIVQTKELREKLEDGSSGFLKIQFEGEYLRLSSYYKDDLTKFEKKLNFYVFNERLQYFQVELSDDELEVLKFVLDFKKELINQSWIPDLNWMPFIKLVEEKNGDTLKSTILLQCSLAQKQQILDKLHHSLTILQMKHYELTRLEAELLRINDQDTRVSIKNQLFDRMALFYRMETIEQNTRLVILQSKNDFDRMMSQEFKAKLQELKSSFFTLPMESAMKFDIFLDFQNLPRYSPSMNGVFDVAKGKTGLQREMRFYGKNQELFQFYKLSLDNALSLNIGILQEYKAARLHYKHLKNKIPSIESSLKCEIKTGLQERGVKPSVLHFNISKSEVGREQFSEMKVEIAKRMQNRVQNLAIQKWILLLPLHLMKGFQTLYQRQEYPLDYQLINRAQNEPLWLVKKKQTVAIEEGKEELEQKWKSVKDSDVEFHNMLEVNYQKQCLNHTYAQGEAKYYIDTESNDMSEWLIKRVKVEEIKEGQGVQFVETESEMPLRRIHTCIEVSFVKKHLARHSYQKQLRNCLEQRQLVDQSQGVKVLKLKRPLVGLDKTFMENQFFLKVDHYGTSVHYLSIKDEMVSQDKDFSKEEENYLRKIRTWIAIHKREKRAFWETLSQQHQQVNLKVINVKIDSEEGSLVQTKFKESIDNARLQSIMRVQDFRKWNTYAEFKTKSTSQETKLFLATMGQSPEDFFLKSNLMKNQAKKMIISNDGAILRKYAFTNSEDCHMIVLARVVTGKFKLRWGSIQDTLNMTDDQWEDVNCINIESEEYGDVYIVKEEAQVYPEYILSFK